MTPSSSWTIEGFLRGLHAELMAFAIVMFVLLVVLLILRRVMSASGENVSATYRHANKIVGFIAIIIVAGFVINAAIFATNVTPHSELDETNIYQQMNSNIKN